MLEHCQLSRDSKEGFHPSLRQRELDLPWSDWEVKPEEVEICQREDGSLWELGHGGFGSVRLHHSFVTSM